MRGRAGCRGRVGHVPGAAAPPARLAGRRALALAVAFAGGTLALAAGPSGCSRSGGPSSPQAIASASTLSAIQSRGVLKVAIEPTFWPMEYKDEQGEVVGLDVDLVKELAESLEVDLDLVDMKFDGIIPALESGQVDLAVSGITATLKRAKKVAFSRPYFLTELVLLIHKDSKVKGARDLDADSVTLALKRGTTGFFAATARFPRAKQKLFDEETACALEVAQGRADAFLYDKLSILKHHEQHKDLTRVNLEQVSLEPYAIMFRQGEPDLARFLDQFIDTLERDGRLEAIRRKHLTGVPGS